MEFSVRYLRTIFFDISELQTSDWWSALPGRPSRTHVIARPFPHAPAAATELVPYWQSHATCITSGVGAATMRVENWKEKDTSRLRAISCAARPDAGNHSSNSPEHRFQPLPCDHATPVIWPVPVPLLRRSLSVSPHVAASGTVGAARVPTSRECTESGVLSSTMHDESQQQEKLRRSSVWAGGEERQNFISIRGVLEARDLSTCSRGSVLELLSPTHPDPSDRDPTQFQNTSACPIVVIAVVARTTDPR
jgi:hypothetical protein